MQHAQTAALTAIADEVGQSGMNALAQFVDVLQRTEWLTAEELVAYQRKPLSKLLRHAFDTVPIYRDRLSALFRGDGSVDWDKWGEIPFLNRSEVQERQAQFLSGSIPKSHGECFTAISSGSTGQPIEVTKTELANLVYFSVRSRYHDWHGIDRNLKYASIRHADADDARYPDGKHNAVWAAYARYMGVDCRGPEAILNINTPVEQQAEWLVRERPDYLHTFPTNAAALADLFANSPPSGASLRLKNVLTLSETVPPDARERCRTVFGAKLIDNYNSVECGYFAIQCPVETHYHVQSEVALVEVLDATDRPCKPGELGRVVVTPFYNYAMPLVRYETNDIAMVGGHCSCGRNSPVLTRIVGRSRNMFHFPDNTSIVPEFTGGPFAKFLRPRRWQVAQTGPLELEVRFVAGDVAGPMDYEGMTDHIRKLLRRDLTVSYKVLDSMPVSAAGKHEPYICELPQ